jgi:hypothetical protein
MTPKDAYEKSLKEGKGFSKYEGVISGDAEFSYLYAKNVCKGSFRKGEPSIKENNLIAFLYCRDVIMQRWYDAEDKIKKSPSHAFKYARQVVKGRWPEAEDFISKDPTWAAAYASEILCSRWPDAEKYIARRNDAAEEYIKALKDFSDWTHEEIARSPVWMYYYAKMLGEALPEPMHSLMESKGEWQDKYAELLRNS